MRIFGLLILLFSLFTLAPSSFADAKTKKGEISMEKAKQIATKEIHGKIKSSEYEFEKGQNVYSFDIVANDGTIHEILVSARTGKIVSSTVESAKKEADEEKSDKKKEQD